MVVSPGLVTDPGGAEMFWTASKELAWSAGGCETDIAGVEGKFDAVTETRSPGNCAGRPTPVGCVVADPSVVATLEVDGAGAGLR